jgi:hypothetical protein
MSIQRLGTITEQYRRPGGPEAAGRIVVIDRIAHIWEDVALTDFACTAQGTGAQQGILGIDPCLQCITRVYPVDRAVPPDITECDAIGIESIPPEIQVQDLVVVSTGYMTAASPRDSVTATDRATIGGPEVAIDDDHLVPTVVPEVDLSGPFRPGRYDITWTATDDAGNTTVKTQTLDVLPLVKLGSSQITGESRTISVPVTINGNAPEYPVSISYALSGAADTSDYAPLTGTLDITSGTEGSLLLRKPTSLQHGGGPVLNRSDPDYITLLNWIRNGMPD